MWTLKAMWRSCTSHTDVILILTCVLQVDSRMFVVRQCCNDRFSCDHVKKLCLYHCRHYLLAVELRPILHRVVDALRVLFFRTDYSDLDFLSSFFKMSFVLWERRATNGQVTNHTRVACHFTLIVHETFFLCTHVLVPCDNDSFVQWFEHSVTV